MAAVTVKRIGYGQVEPNHLSAPRTHQIYAQLPAASAITQLENGQFAKYDYAAGEVNFTGEGEWMLVNNEVKLYDGWRESYKDFVFKPADFTDGKAFPRLFKTNVGDIFTTNCLEQAGAKDTEKSTAVQYDVADHLVVNANGFLKKDTQTTEGVWDTTEGMIWKVVKVYTMPDAKSQGLKLQRIQ